MTPIEKGKAFLCGAVEMVNLHIQANRAALFGRDIEKELRAIKPVTRSAGGRAFPSGAVSRCQQRYPVWARPTQGKFLGPQTHYVFYKWFSCLEEELNLEK